MEDVRLQLSSCLLLLLTGMALGGFLDLYRVLRGVVRAKNILTPIGDLLFWVFALIFFLPLLYWSTWLELRLYVWLSLLSGVGVYYLMFSRIMIPVFLRFWRSMTWLPRRILSGFSSLGFLLKRFWQRKKRNR